jgi:hypothetical protein
MEDSNESKLK